MKKFILLSILFISIQASACLNLFAVDSAGNVHYLEHHFFKTIEFKQQSIAQQLKKIEQKFAAKDYSYQNLSDYGAYLLMGGRFSEGLQLFRALSKKHPGIYQICANTAVAYELNGNVDSALLWERAAMKLNSYSHGGSEWIHLKILEAKKELESDPDWCLTHNVTGIVDSIKKYYVRLPHEDGKGRELLHHFIAQLNERLPFTYGEDKVLGKLLMELGDAYQAASLYRAYYCYAMAKYFYPTLADMANERMQKIKNTYPTPATVAKIKPLEPGSPNIGETKAPNDTEVKAFISKLINRPAIKGKKIRTLPIDQLIKKIK